MAQKESRKAALPVIPELLAPAGNMEKLVTAIQYGADALYLAGKRFGLRAKAGNFDPPTMAAAIAYARARGVKTYVTINIIAHNADLAELDDYLRELADLSPDGLIVADPGVLVQARELAPQLAIHLSTQANVTNYAAARFWLEQGAARLNLARELSLAEIAEIRAQVSGELEVFVHGALCISYSGRCMLSSYMTGRDANQGNCAHPCRYSYALVEEKRPGQYFPVEEDERGTYIFNAKDLCLLEKLPMLVAAGVNALKIEGRMKSIFYVGGVVRVYRAALDYLAGLPAEAWGDPAAIRLPEELIAEIGRTGTRGTTENFISAPPGGSEMIYTTSRAEQDFEPIAVVRAGGTPLLVEVRNTLSLGEQGEYMGLGMSTIPFVITAMTDEKGTACLRANPGNLVLLRTDPPLAEAQVNAILRRQKPRQDGEASSAPISSF